MLVGFFSILAFTGAMIVIIAAIGRYRVHPFLAILGSSLALALLTLDVDAIPDVVAKGFSGIFGGVGLIVVLGALVGAILERSGAALTISDRVVRLFGARNPEAAIMLTGWLVSIPVFCDSGFVLLNPARKALVRRVGSSSVAATVAI
ncbi:MAG: GntP family permease, partial [Thermoguttaceae bacterium]|nr:GntP family permease [Thermoguttaceae bacterium]